jgi:serine/threonine-protein kinase
LSAILASRPFANAVRARRFLTYIVEETLAGRTDAIKEPVLGTEVFDRAVDFDPKLDTIVRVEAGRLRKRLEEYYAGEGAAADLRIEVPLGSYVPQFQGRAQPPAQEVRGSAAGHRRQYAAVILAVLLIAACAWWAVRRFRAPSPISSPSVAVLPFLNLSPDPANEYFTDGLGEELTDALSNAGGLRVAARTSAFSFKGKSSDVHEIGAKLGVAFVVEGSVRKQGDRLKVTAQLTRTDDGYQVWSGSFERKLSDVFEVQQELAGALVTALQLKMTGAQTRRLRKTHTASQQAFDLYLQGKNLLNLFNPASARQAEDLFTQSIAADPAYALSYMGLADAYALQNGYNPSLELASREKDALQRALTLDDELAEAYSALGIIAAKDYNWAAAEHQLRKALELNPSLARAHSDLAQSVLAPQGRWREALAENRLASELDPTAISIAVGDWWLAILQRRYGVAVDGLRSVVAAHPHSQLPLFFLAQALMGKGDYHAALDTAQEIERLAPKSPMLAFFGHIQTRVGNPAEARKILQQLLANSRRGQTVSPISLALIYVGLGDGDSAFRYLEMAREQHDFYLVYARVHFIFDPFRGDPRFLTLLSKIGLSDEQTPKNQ